MDSLPGNPPNGIAIIGMAGRFPGAGDVERFWENLVAGVESITFFSEEELRAVGVEAGLLADPSYVRARAVIAEAELFDAALFGFSPREAEVIDPQQRLLLECAWEALERAGYDPRRFPGPIGVFAGAGINTYLLSNLQHNPEVMGSVGSFQAMLGSGGDFLSTRISYKLGLRGPSLTVQTACSTSLVAVHLAVQSLLNGECDMALAGGVRLLVPRKGGHQHQPGGIFSRDGHCRAFDAAATGTTEGEGFGLVVLKRLADAVADGDHIHSVILGSAINNDGSAKMGYTVPSVEGQSEVIAMAQALAGIDAGTIGLIEAHGTGTPLGDPIEVSALSRVFATAEGPVRACALGSLKSNLGHLDAAAGIASLIKASLAVEHGLIPPSLHFESPNPQLDLASSPFYVPVEATPWRADGPRRAGVSSFGIGGTNAHVVLEEAPEVPPGTASRPLQLVVLSARTQAALERATQNLAEHLRRHPGLAGLDLADVAYTLQVGRVALDHCRIVVSGGTADAAEVLSALDPKRVLTRTREAGERAVFFLFPGQGSQHPGMGAELYRSEPVFREEVDRCAKLLRPRLGLDLRQVLYPEGDPEGEDPQRAAERLRQTALAQPALFVVEYALARLWMSWGVRPEAMLGHSVGEYVAACLAGVFSLEDALRLVAERGRLMQEMAGGSMLAVSLPEAEVRPLLGGLSLAAVNGPSMCVVSGEPGEVEDLAARLGERGVQVRRLHTSHAFHSAAMDPVLERFAAAFTGLRLGAPGIPFLSNLTGAWIRPEEATSPGYWVRHLRETVRFSAGLEALFAKSSPVFLEVGPGQALTALVRQHPKRPGTPSVLASLPTAGDGRAADAALLRTLGQLWLAGVEIDWAGFHAHERRLRVPLPTYPFERERYWVEPVAGLERARRPAAGVEGDVADWFWVPLWHQALPPGGSELPDGAAEGSWLLFAGEGGFGDRLAARLRERGRQVVVARAGERFEETGQGDFTVRPGAAADYGALLDRLAEREIAPARIVHLWSAGPPGGVGEAGREQERGFFSLLHLARALGDRRPEGSRPPLHLGIVSTGVQRVTGAEELVPARATLLGPAATLPQEYPGITCAAIDVTLPPPGSRRERRFIDTLLAELAVAPADPIVAFRGTDRWLRVFEPLRLESPPGPLRLHEGGTYLITGGRGGVGLELAGLLARLARAKLVLTGRTPFPGREAWPALAQGKGSVARTARRLLELEAAGAEVWTAAADVTDAASMRWVLDEARERFGRIHGVIHAAGLPGGGLMQWRSLEDAEAVLAPKVQGTLVLEELLAGDAPDFLVLCSSLNALVGGPGQADYTAANAFLDAFAQSRHGDLPVVSINWDAWRGVGMAAPRREEEQDRGPEATDLRPFFHPLLRERGVFRDGGGNGEGAVVFAGRLRPREDWIIDEHRLGGHPVVPGTAYLEMAGAAFRGVETTDGAIAIRDVQFITPMRVGDDETREFQTVLRRNGDGLHHFSVRSRDGEGWQEHVLGTVGAETAEEPVRIDVSSFDGWEEEILGEEYREDLQQAGLGPRWEVLRKVYRRDGEYIGLLELAPEFAGDVEEFRLHPALLDAATSFAEYYVPGTRSNYYLPLSYKRLRVMGALPARIYSHVRLHDPDAQGVETLAFDISILDETGLERVRVEEFTMKRVDVSAALRGHARRGSTQPAVPRIEETLGSMDPERAVEAFRRILASGGMAQIAVSVRPLPEVLERSRSITAESLAATLRPEAGRRHTRPDLETPYVAPRGEIEERLAAIWADVLGLDRVGAADDFFELGGHSLLGTQVMSRVREAFGVDVPLGKLFEAATVTDFAAVVGVQGASAGASGQDAIPRSPRGGELPLSFAQARLWFLDQFEPGGSAYSMAMELRVRGPFNLAGAESVLGEIVRRHEALRTAFRAVAGEPKQIISPRVAVFLPVIDLAGLPTALWERETERLAEAEARQPFDLGRAPLLRAAVLRQEAERHAVLLNMHHIVSDGWSWGVLVREFGALYEAFLSGAPSPLPELAIQYADFAAWQRGHLSGALLESELAWWRGRLAGVPPTLDLPADHPRSAAHNHRAAFHELAIDSTDLAGLESLSRSHGATLFMALFAGFAGLLRRYTGQDDLAMGMPVAGRLHRETEPLIGLFVNTLVLRTDLSGNPDFLEILRRVRETTLAAYAHQEIPFERLVEELKPERSLNRPPLVQVLFVQDVAVGSLELPGLAFTASETKAGTAKFELTCKLTETGSGMAGTLEYSRDLFDGSTMERLAGHLTRLLAGAVEDPLRRLSELPLLSATERRQLLDWNAAVPEVRGERTLPALFEAQVRRSPEAPAVSFEAGTLSYDELNRRANRLARHLRRLGVGPESRVGVLLERSFEQVVALLGILKAGGAYVPFDPSAPLQRLAFLCGDSGIQVLVTDGRDELPPVATAVRLGGPEQAASGEDDRDLPALVGPENLCYVIYTSGSTGLPKGVQVRHGSVSRLLSATERWFGFGPADVWTLFHSYSFDFSVWELWGALAYGGRLVVVPYWVIRSPETFWRLLLEEGVTVLNQTPSAFRQLLQADGEVTAAQRAGLALRLVIFGGEALDPGSLGPWYERHAPGAPRLVNMYGITETTVHVSYRPLDPADLAAAHRSPIGVAIPDLGLRLLDARLELVPSGVAGEICVGGAGLARGYLGRPELTAERFVPDPFSRVPGERLYRSGDLARYRPDGELDYLGRGDSQVKVRGFRIEPGEIEGALLAHGGVRSAVVLPRQGSPGGTSLVAYVETARDGASAGELRELLRGRLPEYMVPAAFVLLESMPLTANGKLDRRALAGLPLEPEERSAAGPPRTPAEELVAGIFAEVLSLEGVGAEANFFELGGHSLLATQVASRVRTLFGVDLPVREVFEAPTVEALAGRVESRLAGGVGAGLPAIGRVPGGGRLELSFAQQRLWFLDQLEPGSATYNIPAAVRLAGGLDRPALAASFAEIVRRHEVLRTKFPVVDGQPAQVVSAPGWEAALPLIDLVALPPAARSEETRRLTEEAARSPFDLTRDPMLRVSLLSLAAEEHVALAVQHHIASDGWSLGVLARELAALYAAFTAGAPSPLPELAIQYADYAAWQRRLLTGERLEAELAFWRQHLAGAPAALDLPTDRPRLPVASARGDSFELALGGETLARLGELSRRHGATLFMTLLAAFAALLERHTGQEDLIVGTPIAGRTRAETEALIGFFVNTLALRVDLSGSPDFLELLGRVRETALAAYAHQELPFERLVEELAPERGLSRPPLVQAILVLQNAPAGVLALPGLELEATPVGNGAAVFELTFSFAEIPAETFAGGGALAATIEYNRDLFDASTIARLAGHFERLLTDAVASPGTQVAELRLLSDAERRELLAEWGLAPREAPPRTTLAALFAAQVERTPDVLAVVLGGEQLTYRELDGRAARWARHLRRLGVGPETIVGVCLEPSPDLVVALFAIWRAGGAFLPLDPAYPGERLAFMLEDSGAPLVLTRSGLMGPEAPGVRRVLLDELAPDDASAVAAPAVTRPEDLAYVIYTSGSTGRPKGVAVQQGEAAGHVESIVEDWGLSGADRLLQFASPSFDTWMEETLPPLVSGATVVLRGTELWEPALFLSKIRELGLTGANMPTTFWLQWLREGLAAEKPGPVPDLPLRLIWVGGEVMPGEAARLWLRSPLGGVLLGNAYGPTEVIVTATYCVVDAAAASAATVSLGRPLAGRSAHVLDRRGRLVPAGVPGELCLGGALLARGYFRRPDLTAERFIPDPFSPVPGGRLYRSGDLVRAAGGRLEYLGRTDQQVKVRGFRIELGEIETALLEHGEVRSAVVLSRADSSGGGSLVAWVETAPGVVSAAELRELLRGRLPEHMVPSAFGFLESMPLTPNGKVDRRALAALPLKSGEAGRGDAPRTPVEELVAGIFADVLKLEWVGTEDNFFELGGHSLLATQVASRARSSFGVELPLRLLFQAPTVAAFALLVEEARREAGAAEDPRDVPLVRVPHRADADLPLSFAQERLWFLDQLQPGLPIYILPVALRLVGPLAADALERSFGEVVRRHEALRTRFPGREGRAVQSIAPPAPFPLARIDLSGLAGEARQAESMRLIAEESRRPFDLARDPLLRAALLRLGAGEHVLLATIHHIVSDGWSLGVLVRELGSCYESFRAGEAPRLPELPIQYADYARWQREWLRGEVLEAQLAYWKRQLGGGLPPVELPGDRQRPAVATFRGGGLIFEVRPALIAAVERLGRGGKVTTFMVLFAAFSTLLHRYTGQEDLPVGSPIAGRTRRETEPLIGLFVNTLVLRGDLSGDPTVLALLDRVQQISLDAYAHQDVPFEKVVDALQPQRDLSRTPLFQVLFNLPNAPMEPLRLPELEPSFFETEAGVANFDLELSLVEIGEGLTGLFRYSSDLFDASTIARLADHFRNLLEGMVAGPERRLSELPLLSTAERRQLLGDWVDPGPAEPPVHEQLALQAARTPEAVALVWRGERLTYRELDRRANALAHRLCAAGVEPGAPVGLLLERSPELVIGLLGIWKAGGAFLPLDPDYPQERLDLLLTDSGSRLIVTREAAAGRLPAGIAHVAIEEVPAAGEPAPPEVAVGPETLAYVIYTSGSTGRPKGVLVEQGNLSRLMQATRRELGWDSTDVMPCLAKFSFDIFLFELLGPLLAGGTSVLVKLDPVPDLEEVVALLERSTRLHAVPALMRQIVDWARIRGAAGRNLRALFVGGDAVPVELLRDLREVFPQAEVRVLYGPTEGTILATSHRVGKDPDRTLIGRPFPGMKAVLKDRAGNLVPVGVPGEIHLGGVGVTRGYLDREELTREKYVFWEGERWYRTGDLARRLPGGDLEFLGRVDEQVKVRGVRVEPGEIEAVLGEHPKVRESAVVAQGAAGDRRLVAYVVCREGEPLVGGELRSFLRDRMPEPMVPAAFVEIESLPLTAHGKVDRRALAARTADEKGPAAAGPATPGTAAEALLARIWEEVLRREKIGVRDNFFELGGDSILSLQIVARANQAGLRISPRQMFEHQTIAALAAVAGAAGGTMAEQGSVTGPVPLTPVQRRFFEQGPRAPHHFNQAVMLRVRGALVPDLAKRAFAALLLHHDALRLRFFVEDGEWRQLEAPPGSEAPFLRLDLSGLAPAAGREGLARAAEQVQASLDLASGPIARAVWIGLPQGEERLLLVVHHLAVDGVSWRVLLEDLDTACRQLARGEAVVLPPKTTSFQHWAERLVEHAWAMPLEPELSWWLSAGEGISPLPLDAGGENTVASAHDVSTCLNEEETRALLQDVPQTYHTQINDALLAALARTLAGPDGSLWVELEGHGREEILDGADLSRTVGWFTSEHPVRLEVIPGGSPGMDLKAVKEQLRAVPVRGIGYGLLRYLRGGEVAERLCQLSPPDVSFNYLGQLDQALPEASLFAPAEEPAGPPQDRRQERGHALALNGWVAGGRLRIDWTYSEALHRRSTVEGWAEELAGHLRALISHCRSAEAGGYTPSDFNKATLRQEDLDNLLAELEEVMD
jgi:amino acid adenylation domain-containing protein/non-ribosomal peptide synthase protein (TIGR01720 family)